MVVTVGLNILSAELKRGITGTCRACSLNYSSTDQGGVFSKVCTKDKHMLEIWLCWILIVIALGETVSRNCRKNITSVASLAWKSVVLPGYVRLYNGILKF
jgi:hypothetical protein